MTRSTRRTALKPFRRPGLWTAAWTAAIAVVVAASLAPSVPLPDVQHSDKVGHVLAYAALAAGAVQLYARGWALLGAGVGLVLLGIGLEYAQGAFTATRMQDPADAAANALGVVLGLATRLTPLRDLLLRLDGGRAAR